MIAFLAGFVFGIMGFMKLRANAQNPNDPSNRVTTAFMLIFVGAGLIAIPTVMGVGVESLFGDGTGTSNLTRDGGGFLEVRQGGVRIGRAAKAGALRPPPHRVNARLIAVRCAGRRNPGLEPDQVRLRIRRD